MIRISCALLTCLLISCTVARKPVRITNNTQFRLIGQYALPHNLQFKNTTVGGLSSIDYDQKSDLYYMICDDRSSINPARFYTARIFLTAKGIDSVSFIDVVHLHQPDGMLYPNSKQDPYHTPDPEGLRYNTATSELVWTSEGERIIKKDTIILEDPSIITISKEGHFRDSFSLPSNMHMLATQRGPRQNGVFEGLSFANDYKSLFVSVEEPLYEDGPRAGVDTTGWIRIIRFDVKSRNPVAQYAYQIDPVAYPAEPAGAFKINGVPDILALNEHQLLVTERSFSTGRKPCTIKLYLAELNTATDVSSLPSLSQSGFQPIRKTMILNMDSLGIYVDNVEGVCLGPRLPNGHQTLVLVADNNFSADEISQFFLFEIE